MAKRPPSFQNAIKSALWKGHEEIWNRVAPAYTLAPEPPNDLRSRDLFTYALLICEHNLLKWNTDSGPRSGDSMKAILTDRLGSILALAQQMQASSGNFRWVWKSKIVKDPNAVDFCMRAASLISCRYPALRERKDLWERFEKITAAATHALWRPVPEKHTNIALMNARNLIMLGESMGWERVKQEGYSRLDRIIIYTYEWGIHEFNSPTYTGIQLTELALLDRFARSSWGNGNERLKEQVGVLGNHLWSLVKSNWMSGNTGSLAGSSSRQLKSYLEGEGHIDDAMWLSGKSPEPPPLEYQDKELLPIRYVFPAIAHLENADDPFHADPTPLAGNLGLGEKANFQRWGPGKHEFRKSSRNKSSVILSTSSSGYEHPHRQDMPLTVDFSALERPKAETSSYLETYPDRGYVLCDTKRDPYGKRGSHHKPLVWTATQSGDDALGLVLYDAKAHERLETHFVLPISENDEVYFHSGRTTPADSWLHYKAERQPDRRVRMAGDSGKKDLDSFVQFDWSESKAESTSQDPILVLKKGEARVGIRMVWGRNVKGRWPVVRLYFDPRNDDDRPYNAIRFTVLHHQLKLTPGNEAEKAMPWKNAGAALWVRTGVCEGLEVFKNKMARPKKKVVLKPGNPRFRSGLRNVYESLDLSVYTDESKPAPRRRTDESWEKKRTDILRIKLFSEDGSSYTVTDLWPTARDNRTREFDTLPLIAAYRNLIRPGLLRDKLLVERIHKHSDPSELLKAWYAHQKSLSVQSVLVHNSKQYIDLKDSRVWEPMSRTTEPGPMGEPYAWMAPSRGVPGSDVGSILWSLKLKKNTTYFIWARVKSESQVGAFNVALSETEEGKTEYSWAETGGVSEQVVQKRMLSAWWTGRQQSWTWVPLDITEIGVDGGPSPLTFGSDRVRLQLFAKRAGTKISHLFITRDLDEIPSDKDRLADLEATVRDRLADLEATVGNKANVSTESRQPTPPEESDTQEDATELPQDSQ